MDDRLVHSCNPILRSLLDGKTTVNSMPLQTGLSKNSILKTNPHLEKAQLILRTKNKKIKDKNLVLDDREREGEIKKKLYHSQAHIIKLSDLGHDIALFLKSLEEFENSFKQFTDMGSDVGKYESKFGVDKKKLLRLDWSEHDIANYDNIVMDMVDFKVKVLDVALEVIAHKYGVFLIKFDPNPIAKEFLQKVIGGKITDYVFRKIEIITNDTYKNIDKNDQRVKDFIDKKKFENINDIFTIKFLEAFENTNNLLDCKLTSNATKKLLICIIYMMELKRDQFNFELSLIQRIKENPLAKIDAVKESTKLISLFDELFRGV